MSLIGYSSRTIQLLLGLVASGGLALFLGGQAWAATSSADDGTTRDQVATTALIGTDGHHAADGAMQAGTSRDEQSEHSATYSQRGSQGTKTILVDQGGVAAPADAIESTSNMTNEPTAVPAAVLDTTSMDVRAVSKTDAVAADQRGVSSTEKPLLKLASTLPAVSEDTPSVPVAMAVTASPTAVDRTLTMAPGDMVPPAFGAVNRVVVMLPLQPVVTAASHDPLDGLGGALPAPPRNGNNVPDHSFSYLGQLTLGMAGVMPLLQSLASAGVTHESGLPGGLLWLGLVMVVGLILQAAFTAWLRRSGFVGAARSDVADLVSSVSWTTNWDHVTTERSRHDPFCLAAKEIRAW